MVNVPTHVWSLIAEYVPPNPVSYTNLSHVCQSSRPAFLSDSLWRRLTPLSVDDNFARHFFERLEALDSSNKLLLAQLWKDVAHYDFWSSKKDYTKLSVASTNWDLALPWAVLVGAKLFRGTDDWDDFDIVDMSDEDDDEDDEDDDAMEQQLENLQNLKLDLPFTFPAHLFSAKPFALAAVSLWGPLLNHCEVLKADKTIVLAAVSSAHSLGWSAPETDGHSLRFASRDLQNDRKIVQAAISGDGLSFEWASEALRKDPAFVHKIAQIDGRVLAFASPTIRGNKKIVLDAITHSGYGLAYASHELKGDREVVMTAVQTRGSSLRDALPRLKIDRDIIDAAIANDPTAEKYIPEDIDELREMLGVAYLPPKGKRGLF